MLICFTTHSCPSWSPQEIARFAREQQYDAVELRSMNGGIVPPDLTPAQRREIKQVFADAGVPIVCVGTSARFASPDPAERARNEELVVPYLEMAAEWGATLVRVFGGNYEGNQPGPALFDRVAESLARLAPKAAQYGIRLALETHDAFSRGEYVAEVLRRVRHPNAGACWDILHPVRSGEEPTYTFSLLREFLIHTHTKDARRSTDGRWEATLFGEGELPIGTIIGLLKNIDYRGPLSLEWEGKGEPGPARVLEHYSRKIREYLRTA